MTRMTRGSKNMNTGGQIEHINIEYIIFCAGLAWGQTVHVAVFGSRRDTQPP